MLRALHPVSLRDAAREKRVIVNDHRSTDLHACLMHEKKSHDQRHSFRRPHLMCVA
jgi:hypothetical protein